jgi:L-lactate utilization protein LutB
MTIASLGGRKFLLCVGCGAITSILLWFGKLDGSAYQTVILGTVGAFVAGNVVAQKRVDAQKDGP